LGVVAGQQVWLGILDVRIIGYYKDGIRFSLSGIQKPLTLGKITKKELS